MMVQRISADHEVCAYLTELGAVEHKPQMILLDMGAPFRQAVLHGLLQAGLITGKALFRALVDRAWHGLISSINKPRGFMRSEAPGRLRA
jgi:hypothetical protein